MAFDERTKQYLPEEEIIKDVTGKPNASKARNAAVDKLTAAFAGKIIKEQEEKEAKEEANEEYQNDVIENMSKKVEEAIADIEANGYQANYVKTDAYGNPIMGTETENQRLLRVMKQHKQHLEAAVRLASRNVERQDKLIDEYKATDKLITKLEKAIKKAAMKQY